MLDHVIGPWCIECSSYSCTHSPTYHTDGFKFQPSIDPVQVSSVHVDSSFAKVTVCSYNCLSLVESKKATLKGLDVAGRCAYLRLMCTTNSVSVLGLQETGTSAAHYCVDDFVVIASGCDESSGSRCFGLEFWINLRAFSMVDAHGEELNCTIDSRQIITIHSAPRVLLISCKIGCISVYFLNAHAPCRSHGADVCVSWWADLSAILRKYLPQNATIFATIDANGRVGIPSTECIGDHCPSEQCTNGMGIHELGLHWHLFAPATFHEYHDSSDTSTFHHHRGSSCRIDYVLCPLLSKAYPCVAGAASFLCDAFASHDHTPVYVSACFPLSDHMKNCPKQIYNKRLLPDVACKGVFKDLVDKISLSCRFADANSFILYVKRSVSYALSVAFPRGKNSPIRPYISHDTLSLITQRKHARSSMQRLRAQIRMHHIRVTFASWKKRVHSMCSLLHTPLMPWPYPMSLHYSLTCAYLEFRAAACAAKKNARHERNEFVELKCIDASAAFERHDYRTFYRCYKDLFFRRAPGPCAVLSHGSIATEFSEVRLAFMSHFNTLLSGNCVSWDEAQVQMCSPQLDADVNNPMVEVIPDDEVFGHLLSKLKSGRSPGPDGIPFEAFKCSPIFAREALLVVQDFISRGDYPFDWLGATLQEIPKKGSKILCSNYRDILLANTAGKIYKKALRSSVAPFIDSYILDSQCGGFAHRGVDFGSHFVRNRLNLAKHMRMSLGILFLDVQSAFASIMRCLAVPQRLSDLHIFRIFNKLGFQPSVFGEFIACVSGPSACQEAGLPGPLMAQLT